MPSKKKKYNARFPAGRIKKIMQTDEEVGKVAQAVPIIISRTLELFVESLLSKAVEVTNKRNAKTLSPSHIKQCILSESRFDFLKDLVKNIPDISLNEEREIYQAASINNSPNSNKCVENSNALGNPGPSKLRRPRQSHKKDNSQSSDSSSDQEPAVKRIVKNTFGNGKNSQKPSANFDDELKAFMQRMNQNQNKKNVSANEAVNSNFLVPSVNIASSGVSPVVAPVSENNGNKQKLLNFYTETLPDTEDDEKEKSKPVYSSVIQPNPEYSPLKSNKNAFGFYKPFTANPEPSSIVGSNNSLQTAVITQNTVEDRDKNSTKNIVPKIHIDLSRGFPANVIYPDRPLYNIDYSVHNQSNTTSNLVSHSQTHSSPDVQHLSNSNIKKAPPPLQTIKRSISMPESSVSAPTTSSQKYNSSLAVINSHKDEKKMRMERSSYSFDSASSSSVISSRKGKPPSLVPIGLAHKSTIPIISKITRIEIDEDYDT